MGLVLYDLVGARPKDDDLANLAWLIVGMLKTRTQRLAFSSGPRFLHDVAEHPQASEP